MGRRKIEIKCITNERNRSVTFLKRKNGLFKKAYELGVLCSVDVAVIIFGGPVGQKHKLYEYCSGDVDKIVKKRLNFNGDRDAKGPEDFGENKGKAEDGEDGEDDEVDDDSDAPAPAKPTKTKAKAAVPPKRAAPARPSSKRHQPKFDDDDDDEALEPTPMDIEPPPPSRTPVIAAVAAAYARSLGNKAAAADGERYPSDHITHEPLPKRQRRDSTSTASSRDPYHHHSSPYHSLPSFGQSNDVGYPGGAYPGSSGTMPPPPPGSNSGHHHHHTHGYGASSYGATHAPDASLPALSLLRHPSVPNLSHYGSPYLGPSSHSHTHSGAPPRLGSGPPPPPMNVNINISRELMDAFALHQAQQGAGGPGIHSSSVAASAHTSGSHRSGPNGLGVHHPPPMSTGSTGFEWPSTTPQPPATPNLGSAGASGSGSGSGPAGDHDTSWLDIFSSSSGSSGAAPTERRESNTGSELMELFGNIASLGDLARSTVVGAVASGGADSGDRKRRFDSM